jgi:hypothetical protein
LDISNAYQAGDKKVFEERKCLAIPLTFENEMGEQENRKRTYVLTEWNYHESDESLLLYWPTHYDFFRAFLMKMMNKPYQPSILNHIYLSRKGSKTPLFRKLALAAENGMPARMGTSSYEY